MTHNVHDERQIRQCFILEVTYTYFIVVLTVRTYQQSVAMVTLQVNALLIHNKGHLVMTIYMNTPSVRNSMMRHI